MDGDDEERKKKKKSKEEKRKRLLELKRLKRERIYKVRERNRTRKIPNEVVEKFRFEIRSQNKFKLVRSLNRNIVLFGRSGIGMSEFVNVLKNPSFIPNGIVNLFPDTDSPQTKFHSFSIEDSAAKNTQYSFNVIESPGVFSAHKFAKTCLESEIIRVHCVLIFITSHSSIRNEEIQLIENVMKYFSIDSGVKKALIFSRMEGEVFEKKKNLVSQLQKHAVLKKYLKNNENLDEFCHEDEGNKRILEEIFRMNKKEQHEGTTIITGGTDDEQEQEQDEKSIIRPFLDVLFSGCVRPFSECYDEEGLEETLTHVSKLREMILRYIFSCHHHFSVIVTSIHGRKKLIQEFM